MKMERAVEDNPIVDLNKPSLEALSVILRNREMWPDGFVVWDYTECNSCAMGMAGYLWDIYVPDSELMAEALAIPASVFRGIFVYADERRNIDFKDITPEMVADDIDAYLVRTATEKLK